MYLKAVQIALAQLQHIFHPTSTAPKAIPKMLSAPSRAQEREKTHENEEEQGDYTTVHLPQMFTLFLSGDPPVNPQYAETRAESERWIAQKCAFNDRATRRLSKTDFSYFCSITAPRAGRGELRTVCDWGNWVFPFDDMFDNGSLREDPTRAQDVIESLLAGMGMGMDSSRPSTRSKSRADDPLIQVHNSVWERIVRASPVGTQRRFAKAMHDYCMGSLAQVQNASRKKFPSIEEMLALRRQSAGVAPLFALVEYAHKLDIPDFVFETKSIREIERIGVDFVLIQNDILSYCKEEREGVSHNLVAIARRTGLSAQSAFTHIGDMLLARYRDWYLALAELPSWGEDVDLQVQVYIEGVRGVVRANLGWSFRSQRYFGEMAAEVRRTGVIKVKRVV
ncbi:terpene synthase metal binding domain protein [Aspergillus pseudoustus]|uniref:Terpene synthase n=1 Tax=Aspergillus pseudoustus TaxID=1810923 RepID=A0ABR4JYY6_9EURO